MNKVNCPHCKRKWDGKECEICGFADVIETLVPCSHCEEMMPDWATTCVKCWHERNRL